MDYHTIFLNPTQNVGGSERGGDVEITGNHLDTFWVDQTQSNTGQFVSVRLAETLGFKSLDRLSQLRSKCQRNGWFFTASTRRFLEMGVIPFPDPAWVWTVSFSQVLPAKWVWTWRLRVSGHPNGMESFSPGRARRGVTLGLLAVLFGFWCTESVPAPQKGNRAYLSVYLTTSTC